MIALLLIACVSCPETPQLLAMHRADVARWWEHTPEQDRFWALLTARGPRGRR